MDDTSLPIDPRKPRAGDHADRPGHYELVNKTHNPVLDAGDVLRVDQYITGYGLIESWKLVMWPPPSACIDVGESAIFTGFQIEGSGTPDERLVFGGQKLPWSSDSDAGVTFQSGGAQFPGWDQSAFFFDANKFGEQCTPPISTEKNFSAAPVAYHLKLHSNVRPGRYFVDVALTYFNGETWHVSRRPIEFTVRNILQRHEKIAWRLSVVATVLAVIRFGVYPVIQNWTYIKWHLLHLLGG